LGGVDIAYIKFQLKQINLVFKILFKKKTTTTIIWFEGMKRKQKKRWCNRQAKHEKNQKG
jgi:hypothetical protein